jgi:hypothetical protein
VRRQCSGGLRLQHHESAITPNRFIAFGDAFSDAGQTGSRYTVNNGTVNNWTVQLASRYGKTVAPVSTGGLSYAQGNARVCKPDAAGNASTPPSPSRSTAFWQARLLSPTTSPWSTAASAT